MHFAASACSLTGSGPRGKREPPAGGPRVEGTDRRAASDVACFQPLDFVEDLVEADLVAVGDVTEMACATVYVTTTVFPTCTLSRFALSSAATVKL